MTELKPILVIVGPTAGGKTRLATDLANRLPGGGECLSADSMQVYRQMDIGTAKPTAAERDAVLHHLLDLVDPSEEGFTVDQWLRLAEGAIEETRVRGRWPIVVGGTNLYVKVLLEGMFEGPEPEPGVRAELEVLGNEELRAELERVDPDAAAKIHSNDRRRTIRAIEVFRASGRPISEHQQQWDRGEIRPDAMIIGLEYPVEVINRRINARLKAMIEAGLIDEARRLYAAGGLGRQAREALGYKQLIDHFEGRCTLDEAIESIKVRTRRYAKQQRTWLRRFRTWPRTLWLKIDQESPHVPLDTVLRWIEDHSHTGASPPAAGEPADSDAGGGRGVS